MIDWLQRTTRSPWGLLYGLMLTQVTFFCSTFNAFATVGSLFAVLSVVVLLRLLGAERGRVAEPYLRPLTIVFWMFPIGLATITWRLSQLLNDNPNFVFIGVDVLAHLTLFASLLVWILRPRYGHVSLLFLGPALVLLCVAAGGVSRSLAAQTTVGTLVCIGFLLASRIILNHSRRDEQAGSEPFVQEGRMGHVGSLRTRFSIAVLVLLTMTTGAVARVTDQVLPNIQTSLQKRLQSSIEAVSKQALIGGMRYVNGTRLGSIRDHLLMDPDAVVLRIYSPHRPGYLRGHVFDQYRRRRWASMADNPPDHLAGVSGLADRVVDPSGAASTPLQSQDNRGLRRFQLTSLRSGPHARFEIHGDPMRGTDTFLPLSTRWLEASSRELTIDHHGVIRLGVDISQPYVAGAQAFPENVDLKATQRAVCTVIDPRYRGLLQSYADTIFRPGQSTREKAKTVEDFFRANSCMGWIRRSYQDLSIPFYTFWRRRHEAHCEYFATASVLLLRCAGVPTRYVTGYVADEFNDEAGDHWVARNRDAHAWAEAYDEQARRWFVVESTPGRTYQPIDPAVSPVA